VKRCERNGLAFGFVLVYLASWVALRWFLRAAPIACSLAVIGFVCVLYVLLVFYVRPRAPWSNRRYLFCLLLVAALSRLILFDVPPETLSDDVYRYVWDGKVQLRGINPYRFSPDAGELIPLREPFHAKINHPAHLTIYPPVAQLLFALGYLLAGSSFLGLRMIYLVLDLLAAWWILRIIGEGRGSSFDQPASSRDALAATELGAGFRPGSSAPARKEDSDRPGGSPGGMWEKVGACRGALFVYLLSPLVVIETYVGMHVDVAGMAFLVGAYRFTASRAPYRALALLMAAVFVKYIAVAAVPVVIMLLVRRRRASGAGVPATALLKWGAWSLGVTAMLFAPYFSVGPGLFQSLVDYSLYWDFNGPIHWLLVSLAGNLAQLARAIVFLGLLGYILLRRDCPPAQIQWSVMALVLTGPAVFPWYLVTLVPFLALAPTLGGLAITTLPFLSYVVLVDYHGTGVWQESPWVRVVEYLPVMVFLTMDLWRRRCIGERR